MENKSYIEISSDKKILDVCCGCRSFWFNKKHDLAVYCDIREEHIDMIYNQHIDVFPDFVCDFTNLPFKDNLFKLVIFDPPHLVDKSSKMFMVQKYGSLSLNWKDTLYRGFYECMRVLEPFGVLVFKWCDLDVSTSEIIDLFGACNLLIGHRSGKKMHTHWLLFMKINQLKVPSKNLFDFS